MKIDQKQLIESLIQKVSTDLKTIEGFKNLSIEQLNQKPDANSWSILECMEHLNLYGIYYLPKLESALAQSYPKRYKLYATSLIGDYFVKSVKVDNNKKMTALKHMTPDHSNLSISTLHKQIKQLEKLKNLLTQAQDLDLVRPKSKLSLTKLFKLRIGDLFRFLVIHNERHVKQAYKVFISFV